MLTLDAKRVICRSDEFYSALYSLPSFSLARSINTECSIQCSLNFTKKLFSEQNCSPVQSHCEVTDDHRAQWESTMTAPNPLSLSLSLLLSQTQLAQSNKRLLAKKSLKFAGQLLSLIKFFRFSEKKCARSRKVQPEEVARSVSTFSLGASRGRRETGCMWTV